MKKYIIPFIVFLLSSCTNKKEINMYYPDGSLHIKYIKINGIKEGQCTQFYQSGQVEVEYFFKNDFKNGQVTTYYENGNVKLTGQYIWGAPIGSYYYYNENNKLDSVIEYILWQENETVFEYLERDTITKDIAQNAEIYKNSIAIFDENEMIDMDKSLYYEVSFDTIVRNGTIRFYLSFSNPYEYYGYNSDSIEFITYVNSIYNEEKVTHQVFSRTSPIHLTGVHRVISGKQFFYAIITLHYDDGIREMLIKVPFETGNFKNIEKRKFTPLIPPCWRGFVIRADNPHRLQIGASGGAGRAGYFQYFK